MHGHWAGSPAAAVLCLQGTGVHADMHAVCTSKQIVAHVSTVAREVSRPALHSLFPLANLLLLLARSAASRRSVGVSDGASERESTATRCTPGAAGAKRAATHRILRSACVMSSRLFLARRCVPSCGRAEGCATPASAAAADDATARGARGRQRRGCPEPVRAACAGALQRGVPSRPFLQLLGARSPRL